MNWQIEALIGIIAALCWFMTMIAIWVDKILDKEHKIRGAALVTAFFLVIIMILVMFAVSNGGVT